MTIVRSRQNLLDIAIQESGTLASLFEIALLNNVSITDDLTAGQEIKIPAAFENIHQGVLTVYKARQIFPATSLSSNQLFVGIGFDYIEIPEPAGQVYEG